MTTTTLADAYQYGLSLLNGRQSRNIGYAYRARMLPDGTVACRYHDTDIVSFRPDGSIVLDNGGWPSMTTKRKMNATLAPLDLSVDGYTLHRGSKPKTAGKHPWLVRAGRYAWSGDVVAVFTVAGESNVFVHNPWNDYYWESPVTGAPGRGSNDGTCERLTCVVKGQ